MIVKIFKSGGVGKNKSANSVSDYLLNDERVKNGTAKIVKGDKDLTDLAIGACTGNSTYTSGCLSFSKDERELTEQEKQQLMTDFEQALLPNFDKKRYAGYWVEHTDKDRLELNFVVAKMDLATGKNLSVYQHSRDIKRLNAWKEIKIQELGLIDPNDPKHERLEQPFFVRDGNKKLIDFEPENSIESNKKQLGEYLKMQVENGLINNRQDVMSAIEALEVDEQRLFEIAKETKTSLTVKDLTTTDPKNTFRLKGGIYARDFAIEPSDREKEQSDTRENDSVISQRQLRRHQEYIANASERLEHAKREYQKLSEWRTDDLNKRHPVIKPSLDSYDRPSRKFGREYDDIKPANSQLSRTNTEPAEPNTEPNREFADSPSPAKPADREYNADDRAGFDGWIGASQRTDTAELRQSVGNTSRHDKPSNAEPKPSDTTSQQASGGRSEVSCRAPSSREHQFKSNILDDGITDIANGNSVYSILRGSKRDFSLVAYSACDFYYVGFHRVGESNHSNILRNLAQSSRQSKLGDNHANLQSEQARFTSRSDSDSRSKNEKHTASASTGATERANTTNRTNTPNRAKHPPKIANKRKHRAGIRLFDYCRAVFEQISIKIADIRQRIDTAVADGKQAIDRAKPILERAITANTSQLQQNEQRFSDIANIRADRKKQAIANDTAVADSNKKLQQSQDELRNHDGAMRARRISFSGSNTEIERADERIGELKQHLPDTEREFEASEYQLEHSQDELQYSQKPFDSIARALPSGNQELRASQDALRDSKTIIDRLEREQQERLERERQRQAQLEKERLEQERQRQNRPRFSP